MNFQQEGNSSLSHCPQHISLHVCPSLVEVILDFFFFFQICLPLIYCNIVTQNQLLCESFILWLFLLRVHAVEYHLINEAPSTLCYSVRVWELYLNAPSLMSCCHRSDCLCTHCTNTLCFRLLLLWLSRRLDLAEHAQRWYTWKQWITKTLAL